MLRVDFRNHHGHILRPAVGGVVGNDGAFQSGVLFLQGADFFLFHIHGAETEVHHPGQLFGVRLGIQHHQRLRFLRAGNIQRPAGGDGLPIGFPGASGAGGNGGKLEPGVVFQQGYKPLAYHTRTADDTDFVLLHNRFLLHPRGNRRFRLNPGVMCIIINCKSARVYFSHRRLSA